MRNSIIFGLKFKSFNLYIMDNVLLVIVGPTAVGKTSAAIGLAKYIGTEIISCDSRQMYREMNIGTAVPSKEELAEVHHHFVGHLSVQDYYNVSMFEQDVLALLPGLFAKNRIVIMTGGSGLYVDAICRGIDDLPHADMELRNDLQEQYEQKGIEWLREQLKLFDPVHYKNVDIKNPQRMLKALEVSLQTGIPYSTHLTNPARSRDFKIIKLGLTRPRPELNERINRRVDEMITSGLEKEAETLYNLRHLNALKTVGYREIFDVMNGEYSIGEAVEKIKTNTRRYAKRQMTWFKRYPDTIWFSPEDMPDIKKFADGI